MVIHLNKREEYKQSWGEYWTKKYKDEFIYGFLQKIMIESNLYKRGKDVTVSDVFKKHKKIIVNTY